MAGKVLTIGESDSCGASGLQADIKTVAALGGYAMTAVSAVAAQNTRGIAHIEALAPWFVEQQMRVVLEDNDAANAGGLAIKVGTLVNAGIVDAVAGVLDAYQDAGIPVVVDPGIIVRSSVASVSEQIMDEGTIADLKRRLFIRARVLTPSLRETELLTGMKVRDMDDMRHAADMMRTLGAEAVLLKAGMAAFAGGEKGVYVAGCDRTLYLLATETGETVHEQPPLDPARTLGLGATLAAAVAVSLAQGMDVPAAAARAIAFLHAAAAAAAETPGARPLHHAFSSEKAALHKSGKA
ncbi:MAG: hydroxymethylpyrimidine/phosphomethylpyrimidine kinase [Alphaproteobacteria bacterium]|nr:hydroxymethylpyrimidine/phosphomethylpyrimidine kinase [Alphaproteobacteria bacterium]MDE2337246.1 hydroxymethylpyrimidine/phosphomethylpyrimidine kinase [Alphaproteobacteria bacterium]